MKTATGKRDVVITDVGKLACGDSNAMSFDSWVNKVEKYIIKNYDNTFPIDKFKEWYDSDSDEPFKWGKYKYYWF